MAVTKTLGLKKKQLKYFNSEMMLPNTPSLAMKPVIFDNTPRSSHLLNSCTPQEGMWLGHLVQREKWRHRAAKLQRLWGIALIFASKNKCLWPKYFVLSITFSFLQEVDFFYKILPGKKFYQNLILTSLC